MGEQGERPKGKPGRKPGEKSERGLDGLTAKQRAFVAARAAGAGKGEAYKIAYSPHAKPTTATSGGIQIERSKAVQAVLERVRAEMEQGKIWDAARVRAWVHSQLLLEATTAPNPAARVKALELLGKNAGMFTGAKEERIPISAHDLRSRLQAKLLEMQGNLGSSPDPDTSRGDSGTGEPQAQDAEGEDGGTPP